MIAKNDSLRIPSIIISGRENITILRRSNGSYTLHRAPRDIYARKGCIFALQRSDQPVECFSSDGPGCNIKSECDEGTVCNHSREHLVTFL